MRKLRALTLLCGLIVAQVPLIGSANAADAITIDIRPGDAVAELNMRSTDMSTRDGAPVPVAILTTPSFAAGSVDVSTVCFGDPNNATQRDCTESHGRGHPEDVDRDGDTDLLLHYDLGQTGIDDGDTRGCLEGRTLDNVAFYGCDAITVKNGVAESQLPNLLVTLVADPSAANASDPVRWTATVTNDGVGAITLAPGEALLRFDAPATLSGVAVNGPAGYACASVCSATDPDTIGVGGTRVFTLDAILPTTPGPVTVKAVVDPAASVTELNEQDNEAEAAALVQAANLTVALTAEPTAVAPGDDVMWRATVRNDGPGAALLPADTVLARFTLPSGLSNVSLNAPTGFTCSPVGTDSYECDADSQTTVGAGNELIFELAALAPTTVGTPEVAVAVDPNDVLVEGSEADNQATAAIFVQDPNLLARLTMTSTNPSGGDLVEWTATITNVGPTRVRLGAGAPLLHLAYSPDLPDAAIAPAAGYDCASLAPQSFTCNSTAGDILPVGADRTFRFTATAPAAGGDVQVTATADPDNLTREADETDNTATLSTAVVRRDPNLSIAMTASPDPVDALATVQWTARITNDGPGAVDLPTGARAIRFTFPDGMLNLFASTPSGYSCFIAAANTVDCATTAAVTIPAGGTVNMTLGGTAPRTPGPLEVSATVDPGDVVFESNETDNSAAATVTVRPPDFSVTLNATPDPVDARHTVTWTATITNDGPANARISNATRLIRFAVPEGMVNLFASSPSGYTCFIEAANVVDCQTTATTNLAAGASVDISLGGSAPREPGSISLTATADPLNVIPEDDETDNSATRAVTVQPPDFSVALNATPDPVDARHTVTWTATITNDGPAIARIPTATRMIRFAVPEGMVNLFASSPSGYTCFIEAANVVDCQTTATTNLAAGASVDISLGGSAPREPGSISLTATADPLNVIPEDDETDNSATRAVTVQPPDFSVALNATPDPVDARHTVTWTATITNDGPAIARIPTATRMIRFAVPEGMVNLFASSPSGYTCFIEAANVVDCQTTATTNLAAGASVDISLGGSAPREPGSISLTATADPLNVIPEDDETDNSATRAVTVQPPDFSMALVGSPDPVAPSTSTTWTATLTNDGPAVARVPTSTVMFRFEIPAGFSSLAVNTPAGYTCFVSAPGVVDCQTTATTSIGVGESVVATLFARSPATPGAYSITATADALGAIPEADETDNAATATINVS